jgi:uncharacterized protein
MEIIGKKIIPSKRETVWHALNDPVILKLCLPGCESVEKVGNDEFKVTIKTAIGPLRARFQGSLKMTEVNAPESCVMLFEGQGGAVGFGKGSSRVSLRAVDEGTELSYEAKAQVGGKLAQVGSRLIDSVAKKMTDDFFKAFEDQLNPPAAPQGTAVIAAPSTGAIAPAQSSAGAWSAHDSAPSHLPVSSSGSSEASAPPRATGASSTEPTVPAWWLAPAAILGAFLAIAGARFIH